MFAGSSTPPCSPRFKSHHFQFLDTISVLSPWNWLKGDCSSPRKVLWGIERSSISLESSRGIRSSTGQKFIHKWSIFSSERNDKLWKGSPFSSEGKDLWKSYDLPSLSKHIPQGDRNSAEKEEKFLPSFSPSLFSPKLHPDFQNTRVS